MPRPVLAPSQGCRVSLYSSPCWPHSRPSSSRALSVWGIKCLFALCSQCLCPNGLGDSWQGLGQTSCWLWLCCGSSPLPSPGGSCGGAWVRRCQAMESAVNLHRTGCPQPRRLRLAHCHLAGPVCGAEPGKMAALPLQASACHPLSGKTKWLTARREEDWEYIYRPAFVVTLFLQTWEG